MTMTHAAHRIDLSRLPPRSRLWAATRVPALGLVGALAFGACQPAAVDQPDAWALRLPDGVAALTEEAAAGLRATLTVGEAERLLVNGQPLKIDLEKQELSGTFELPTLTERTEVPFDLQLRHVDEERDREALLATQSGTLTIRPNTQNALVLDQPWISSGAPIFDLNRNGISNLEDLGRDIDPYPAPPALRLTPDTLVFPSGVELGEVAQQVIVVANTTPDVLDAQVTVVGSPGVGLARLDESGELRNAAQRTLELGQLAPFSDTFVAVLFAPVNPFLTVGDIFVETVNARTQVPQAEGVRVIANVDGELQAPPSGFVIEEVGSAIREDYVGAIEPFPTDALFSGLAVQDLSGGQSTGIAATGATITAVFEDGEATVPADHAFILDVPAEHKLSVSLTGLESDVDLTVFFLEDNDAISSDPARNFRSKAADTSPEYVELEALDVQSGGVGATAARPTRALVVLGRVDPEEAVQIPGGLGADELAPFQLSAHVSAAPEILPPIVPNSGPRSGGTPVVITGRRFNANATVTFGGVEAFDCSYGGEDAEGLVTFACITPDQVPELVANVVVANPAPEDGGDGQAATLAGGFVFDPPAPRLDSVAPSVVTQGSGSTVVLRGAFFSQLFGGPRVFFEDLQATDVTVVDSTRIDVVVPVGVPEGVVAVTVHNIASPADPVAGTDEVLAVPPSNPRNVSVRIPETAAPILDEATPTEGSVDGVPMTLLGANFLEGAQVYVGGEQALDVELVSDAVITCITPVLPAGGPYQVLVVNPDGQAAALEDADGFTAVIPPPELIRIVPSTAIVEGGTFLLLTGSGFRAGVRVEFTGPRGASQQTYRSPNIAAVSSTDLLVATPRVEVDGLYDVRVINVDGQEAELSDALTMLEPEGDPPAIDQVTPNTAKADESRLVTIVGRGFRNPEVLVGTRQVVLEQSGSTELIFQTPTGSDLAGPALVRVINEDGQSDTVPFTFIKSTVTQPVVHVVTPAEVSANQELTLVGDNLDIGTRLVRVGGQDVRPSSVSNTRIALQIPNLDALVGPDGSTVAVELSNDNGESTSVSVRYVVDVDEPRIFSVSPSVARPGEEVRVRGEFFDLAALEIGGQSYAATSSIVLSHSDTEVVFTAPQAPGVALPAVLDLAVLNLDSLRARATFGMDDRPLPAPQIFTVSPRTLTAGVASTVTLVGTGFSSDAEVRAAGDIVTVDIDATGTRLSFEVTPEGPGVVVVEVTNPDGQRAAVSLEVIAPSGAAPPRIDVVQPAALSLAAGIEVTVTGANFAAGVAPDRLTATLGGAPLALTSLTSTSFKFTTSGDVEPGLVVLTVQNPDSQSDGVTLTFEAPAAPPAAAPRIFSVQPGSSPLAGGGTVTLTGENFNVGALVLNVGDAAVTPTAVTATTVAFTVPAAASAGFVTIGVANPDGLEASAPFLYTLPVLTNGPRMDSVAPATVPTSGGDVTITGANFLTGGVLRVGSTTVTPRTRTNTTLVVPVPSRAPGIVMVTWTNADGQVGSIPINVEDPVAAPSIPLRVSAVIPSFIHGGIAGDLLTVTGQGLTGVTGAVVVDAANAANQAVQLATAKPEGINSDGSIRVRVTGRISGASSARLKVFVGASNALSPTFDVGAPTVGHTVYGDQKILLVGANLNPALLSAVTLIDPRVQPPPANPTIPLTIRSKTTTSIATTADPNIVPDVEYGIQLTYSDGPQLDTPVPQGTTNIAAGTLIRSGLGAAQLAVFPIARNVGPQQVNTTSAIYSFTVANRGMVSTGVLSSTIEDDNGTVSPDFNKVSSSCDSVALAPAEQCVVRLQFSPTTVGQKQAYLTVRSSQAGSPLAVAVLSGFGDAGAGVVPPLVITSVAPAFVHARFAGDELTVFGQGLSGVTQVDLINPDDNTTVAVPAVPQGIKTDTSIRVRVDSPVPVVTRMKLRVHRGADPFVDSPVIDVVSPRITQGFYGDPDIVLLGTNLEPPGASLLTAVTLLDPSGDISLDVYDSTNAFIAATPITSTDYVKPGVEYVVELTYNAVIKVLAGTFVRGFDDTARLSVFPLYASFEGQAVNTSSLAIPIEVTNTGPVASGALNVTLEGTDPTSFLLTNPNACALGLAAGAKCTIPVVFRPTSAGPKQALLKLTSAQSGLVTAVSVLTGRGLIPAALTIDLVATEFAPVEWDPTTPQFSPPKTLVIKNEGQIETSVAVEPFGGTHPGHFALVTSETTCIDAVLRPGESCELTVAFKSLTSPVGAAGVKLATVSVSTPGGQSVTAALSGEVRRSCLNTTYRPSSGADFAAIANCTRIPGTLEIAATSRTFIPPLALREVGSLIIRRNSALNDLSGLSSLRVVENELNISENASLVVLRGLEAVQQVGELVVQDNNALLHLVGDDPTTQVTDSVGLVALTTVDDLHVASNAAMTELGTLSISGGAGAAGQHCVNPYAMNVTSARIEAIQPGDWMPDAGYDHPCLSVRGNLALTSLGRFPALTAAHVSVEQNPSLNSVGIFPMLTSATIMMDNNGEADVAQSAFQAPGDSLGVFPELVHLTLMVSNQDLDIDTQFPNVTDVNFSVDYSVVTSLGTYPSAERVAVASAFSTLESFTLDSQAHVFGDFDGAPLQRTSFDLRETNLASFAGAPVAGTAAFIRLDRINGLTSLDGLEPIVTIEGDLFLTGLPDLVDLSAFDGPLGCTTPGTCGLSAVAGTLWISLNPLLETLAGLSKLEAVGEDAYIEDNPLLASLAGLSALVDVGGDLFIEHNPRLITLAGLENLERVFGSFYIANNTRLTSVLELAVKLKLVDGQFNIANNPSLPQCQIEQLFAQVEWALNKYSSSNNTNTAEICSAVDEDCDGFNNEGLDCTFYASTPSQVVMVDPFSAVVSVANIAAPASLEDVATTANGGLLGVGSQTLYLLQALGPQTLFDGLPLNSNALTVDRTGLLGSALDRAYVLGDGQPDPPPAVLTFDPPYGTLTSSFNSGVADVRDAAFHNGLLYFVAAPISVGQGDALYAYNIAGSTSAFLGSIHVGAAPVINVTGLSSSFGALYGVTGDGNVLLLNPADGSAVVVINTGSAWLFTGAADHVAFGGIPP